MNLEAFIAWRRAKEGEASWLCCETRLSKSLVALRPPVAHRPTQVHRCDLARLWLKRRALSDAGALYLCEGVRHALALLFHQYAEEGSKVALPSDVYPVYGKLAQVAGVSTVGFETFPGFNLKKLLSDLEAAAVQIVVLPKPLKLQGRDWSAEDVTLACEWLREDPARRIILDAVYSMGLAYSSGTFSLLESDQVLLLDSLSKGWLHEQVLGAVLVPEKDAQRYAFFKNLPPNAEKLALAQSLLTEASAVPQALEAQLERLRATFFKVLGYKGIEVPAISRGYLLPVHQSVEILLNTHGMLVLPASVFGSSHEDWSILSTLPALRDR